MYSYIRMYVLVLIKIVEKGVQLMELYGGDGAKENCGVKTG